MNDTAKLVSKVLVLDSSPEHHERLKAFCDEHNLVGLKAQDDNVMVILKSNVDLGGILLSEDYGGTGLGVAFGREIHRVRPELPIFLRREHKASLDDLPTEDRRNFRAVYTIDTIEALAPAVAQSIFSLAYPGPLVRGIIDITRISLDSQFRDVTIEHEAPYLVRDRIIYGELFSLIPLESNWCRGYMMLQTEEAPLVDFIEGDKTFVEPGNVDFREINNILGETTNLIWGAFKNRFVSAAGASTSVAHLTQVPIIVNHGHRYISFGSEDAQLCFKYTLSDRQGVLPPIVIHQRFVFNLSWSPDNFSENENSVESLVESGELEMF